MWMTVWVHCPGGDSSKQALHHDKVSFHLVPVHDGSYFCISASTTCSILTIKAGLTATLVILPTQRRNSIWLTLPQLQEQQANGVRAPAVCPSNGNKLIYIGMQEQIKLALDDYG